MVYASMTVTVKTKNCNRIKSEDTGSHSMRRGGEGKGRRRKKPSLSM
jgi:hypothetical protein